ncbi:MAG: glycosyltransferase [Verrucomicrobiota bacterium]
MTSLLLAWSLIAGVWWGIALLLVHFPRRSKNLSISSFSKTSDIHLSIFKPTPPLTERDRLDSWKKSIESFLSQMGPTHEMLLGILPRDIPSWQPTLDHWKKTYPQVSLKIISDLPEKQYPNPKIAWNKTLSLHAKGEFWLWSDLDITVPPHYLSTILREYSGNPDEYLTNAYTIPSIENAPGLLDALFVNVEFFPGVLLLDRLHLFKTAFGAGILFSPALFSDLKKWDHLGCSIGDDFELSRFFQKGTLSSTLVSTSVPKNSFGDSLRHYQRWHKTIRWCDPIGYLGLILLFPLLGALVSSLWNPLHLLSVALLWIMEIGIGYLLLQKTAPQINSSSLGYLILWPWIRPLTWIHSWLPLSVQWGRTYWNKPNKNPLL